MTEMTMARLDEWMIILYAMSLVFYFMDYAKRNTVIHRIALFLFTVVFIMQTTTIVYVVWETGQWPIYSLLDGVYVVAWLLLLVSLLIYLFHTQNISFFVMNIVGFLFMTLYVFAKIKQSSTSISDALISDLLTVHISFALLSYVAFALAFVFAALYLIVYHLLKKKVWTKQFNRYPSLHQTTLGMKWSMYAGLPLLIISILLGIQWANVVFERWTIIDTKVIGSFIVVLFYTVILYLKKRDILRANDFAWAVIIAYFVVLANLFFASQWSSFHYWL